MWPTTPPGLYHPVKPPGSPIVFVNNRRSAERLALRLNELASEEAGPDAPAAEIARAIRDAAPPLVPQQRHQPFVQRIHDCPF